jgi:hypothetical protein
MGFKAQLAAIRRVTPKEGFALVGLDKFDEAKKPGTGLYVIAHFDTHADAEKARVKRVRKNPEETVHVYPPKE